MFRFKKIVLKRGELFREHVVARPEATPCTVPLMMLGKTDDVVLYAYATRPCCEYIERELIGQRDKANQPADDFGLY